MSAIPVYRLWVRINDGQPVKYVARPTLYVASSGYSSGDYEVTIAGVVVRYSSCGTYRATFGSVVRQMWVPLSGPVVFDFFTECAPRLTIVSGSLGAEVTNG